MKHDFPDGERGFTLIELIVVIAMMATLVGVITPMFIKYIEKSKQSADINTAEAACTAAAVYFSEHDGAVPSKLYYNGNDVVDSETGITGYGKSSKDFADFVPDDFPVLNVGGKPNDIGANYIILTMGTSGVEGLGWGVAMSSLHADGTPKYENRIYSAAEWVAASTDDKVARDTELFNSLEASAADMTYGELLQMAHDLGLVEADNDGKLCIKIATSTIYDDKTTGSKGSDVNEIFAKALFRKAGYNTSLSNDRTYIVSSRVGGSTDVWMDLGYSLEEISRDTTLYNSKATRVVVYGEGGTEQLDHGSLDHDQRVAARRE